MLRSLAALCLLAAPAFAADAQPIKILTPVYGQAALQELEPLIEKRIGAAVEIEIVGTGGIVERVQKDDAVDMVVTNRESLEPAKARIQTQRDVAISHVAIGVPDSVPVPVLRTEADVAAFFKSIPSLAYSTSLSGLHTARVIEKLGLTEVMKPKVQQANGLLGGRLAKGEVAAVSQQISELRLAGVKNIAPLPDPLQVDLVVTAATLRASKRAADAAKITAILGSAEAFKAYQRAGLEPFKAP